MTTYEFQSTLHRNAAEMLNSIAYEWMTGGGSNSPTEVDQWQDMEPGYLARECRDGWGLYTSWLESRDCDEAALTEAFARFLRDRPDREHP